MREGAPCSPLLSPNGQQGNWKSVGRPGGGHENHRNQKRYEQEPCLAERLESPTHEIRADADPLARSARSITIRLAHRHTFDRPVEILIHPSEPHMPHVLMEEGDMAPAQYEQHLRGRSDFIKGTKKDPSPEKKVEIIRKRLHKDIPHHPVIMLNFCPDLKTVQPNLRKTHGEFIFLVDRSRSMAGTNIARVKSLMPGCLFNLIGFGSTFKAAFPASQAYSEVKGGTLWAPPDASLWVIRQPIHRGHPRLLFLLTDGAVGNTGKVLGLLRSHASSTRCYTFGIGKNACRRLLKGLAAVTKGSAEFLAEGERVQPKMIKSLKKAMAPVVSDVSVDWVFPETTEVLISPVNTSCLFPGDRLVAYSVVCDTSLYVSHPRLVSGCHRLAPAGLDAHAWSSGLDGPSGPGCLDTHSSAGGDWRGSRRSLCKALVKGLQSGEPVKWEITFDLGPLFQSREDKGQEEEEDIWNETFHHLAAKSIVQDFEQLAEREFEIEHGIWAPRIKFWSCLVGPHDQSVAGFSAAPSSGETFPDACEDTVLVSLQLACGSFLLNKAFSEAINIPLEKLRWTSPFACHRMDLSPSTSSRKAALHGPPSGGPAEIQAWLFDVELQQRTEPEGMLWATAVALAWLEHSSASYFIEWELVAAKASRWLGEQDIPEGRTLPALKTAAQQLFVLLRHWNENLQFNLLCYNPKDV
uniref:von Willebrand factor A domain containing 5B1 n=1 Tax=Naja naja TaxID=35670 RepID=A0A8C6XXG9_NAJNA